MRLAERARRLLADTRTSAACFLRVLSRRGLSFVFNVLQFCLWLILFIIPISLFADPAERPRVLGLGFWYFAVFSIFSTALWFVGTALVWESFQGVLEALLMTNSTLEAHLLGRMALTLVFEMANLALSAVVLKLLTGAALAPSRPLLVLAAYAYFALMAFAVAELHAATMLLTSTSVVVTNIVQWILPFAIFVPPASVHHGRLLLLIPYVHPAELLRAGLGLPILLTPRSAILTSLAMSIGLLLLGHLSLRRAVVHVRRHGMRTVHR